MKKYCYLYLFSYAFLAAGFVVFYKFLFNKNLVLLLSFSALFIAFSVIYRISTKKITFEEGYNLFQAVSFYIEFKKIKSNDKDTDKENMLKLASKYDYARDLSIKELEKMYQTGRKLEKQITSPVFKFIINKKKQK